MADGVSRDAKVSDMKYYWKAKGFCSLSDEEFTLSSYLIAFMVT
jgi:hypothetical protein